MTGPFLQQNAEKLPLVFGKNAIKLLVIGEELSLKASQTDLIRANSENGSEEMNKKATR